MERRTFLGGCAVVSGAVGLSALSSWANVPPRRYAPTRLVDPQGAPLKAGALAAETNYVFHFPFVGTPCFLLNLGRPTEAPGTLRREDGTTYAWQGGVGPSRAIVAFSAICAHKLMYPTPAISFIGLRSGGSGEPAQVIHCCGDNSRYDPQQGARVIAGPAPQPLAAVMLEWDARSDQLHATGTRGGEMFDAFFEKYAMKLELETGSSLRKPTGATAVVRPAASYSKQWRSCKA